MQRTTSDLYRSLRNEDDEVEDKRTATLGDPGSKGAPQMKKKKEQNEVLRDTSFNNEIKLFIILVL